MTPSSTLFVAPPPFKKIQSEVQEVQSQQLPPKKETNVWTIASLSSQNPEEEEVIGGGEPVPEKPPHVKMTGVMTFSSLGGPPASNTSEREPEPTTTLIDLQLPGGTVLNHVFNKYARLHYLLTFFTEESGGKQITTYHNVF